MRRVIPVATWLVVVLGSCTGPPTLEPSIVGIVVEADHQPSGAILVTLVDGGSVRIELPGRTNLEGGARPEPGTLLLFGQTDRGQWFDVLFRDPNAPGGCWKATSFAKRIDGVMQFDNGVRLPIAAGFDGSLGTADGRFQGRYRFCVNERGQVTAYG